MTYLTHKVTSVDFKNNRPALRRHWRTGFGQALPPDLPTLDRDDSLHRLEDYLVDVDWDALRARYGSPERMNEALDPQFQASLKDATKVDGQSVSFMLRQNVPRDIDEVIRVASLKSEQPFSKNVDDPGLREPLMVEDNEISRDRSHERDTSSPSPTLLPESRSDSAPEQPATTNIDTLPAFVRRHFVRADDQFYYRQKPEQLAFETRGETFRAHDSSVSVATAMVELAESRGWSALKVKGSKDFRRLVWDAATRHGITVDGYTPTAGERAMLEQDGGLPEGSSNRGSAKSRTSGNERNRSVDPLAGTVVDHGAAPFQHDEVNSPSYFVALRGASGKVTTHWGKDLDRAIHESGAAIGDQAQLAKQGKQQMRIREPVRNDAGFIIDHQTSETERTAWSVTVRERGYSDRSGAQKGQADTDLVVSKVVELFTSKRLAMLSPEDRAKFRELYDQAKTRLEAKDQTKEALLPSPNEVSRGRNRERATHGR